MVSCTVTYVITEQRQTANVVSADYDRVEDFFEGLSSYLNQLAVLELHIPPLPQLAEVMTEIFTSVLTLFGICTKYMKTRRLGNR